MRKSMRASQSHRDEMKNPENAKPVEILIKKDAKASSNDHRSPLKQSPRSEDAAHAQSRSSKSNAQAPALEPQSLDPSSLPIVEEDAAQEQTQPKPQTLLRSILSKFRKIFSKSTLLCHTKGKKRGPNHGKDTKGKMSAQDCHHASSPPRLEDTSSLPTSNRSASPGTTRSTKNPEKITTQNREQTSKHRNRFPHLSVSNKNKSYTGLSTNKPIKATFQTPELRDEVLQHNLPRASSFDQNNVRKTIDQSGLEQPSLERQPWELPAQEGAGLKSRRISTQLPANFNIDVVELHTEFANLSRVPGRRGKMLGKGATSTVALMTRKGNTDQLYAVKEFRGKQKSETTDEYEKKVKSEFSIANSLHHPNIVETIRLCTNHGKWNHVMEYCQEGDLFNLVEKGYLTKPDRLADRLCLFKQLVQGVEYLHQHGIAHRDIKLENLLINSESRLKITDFGVSEVFRGVHPGLGAAGRDDRQDMTEVRLCAPGICGSMPYIAPEVVSKQGEYDPRPLDVWSSAVVMLHIVFGGALWEKAEAGNKNYDSLVKGWATWEEKHEEGATITESDYPHVAAFDLMVKPPALRRLLIQMLHPDPTKRITIVDVANNRWLKHVECCQTDGFVEPPSVIDASSKTSCAMFKKYRNVHHNHLPPPRQKGHGLVRLPGRTDMD